MITGEQRQKMCYAIQNALAGDGTQQSWDHLVKWWKTPNKILDGAVPEQLKDAGPDGEDELFRLVMAGKLP